jgi:ribonuclease HII
MPALQARAGRARRPLVHKGVALVCGSHHEDAAAAGGFAVVAGLDEVGRGALCGPVVAAAVVLGPRFDTTGLDDSKRLTALQRERLAARVREGARSWAVGLAGPREVDRFNILRATHLAMRRAIAAMAQAPDLLLVDAITIPGVAIPQRPIVKGDAISVSIAAASIVAKVARDQMMQELDGRYPGYGLARNMGYASEDHRDALRRLGPSAVHRRSFVVLEDVQIGLFQPEKGH